MQTCVLVHSEVTRSHSYINGSQSCGVRVHVHVHVGKYGRMLQMFNGNMLWMFCGEFVQVQTSPGL